MRIGVSIFRSGVMAAGILRRSCKVPWNEAPGSDRVRDQPVVAQHEAPANQRMSHAPA
jgi:hypothetical protein